MPLEEGLLGLLLRQSCHAPQHLSPLQLQQLALQLLGTSSLHRQVLGPLRTSAPQHLCPLQLRQQALQLISTSSLKRQVLEPHSLLCLRQPLPHLPGVPASLCLLALCRPCHRHLRRGHQWQWR